MNANDRVHYTICLLHKGYGLRIYTNFILH